MEVWKIFLFDGFILGFHIGSAGSATSKHPQCCRPEDRHMRVKTETYVCMGSMTLACIHFCVDMRFARTAILVYLSIHLPFHLYVPIRLQSTCLGLVNPKIFNNNYINLLKLQVISTQSSFRPAPN